MKKKNIAIFTVARSDYGLLKKIILEAEKDKSAEHNSITL